MRQIYFLKNGKKWGQLVKINGKDMQDDEKAALIKAAYAMGLFGSKNQPPNPEALNNLYNLYTAIPLVIKNEDVKKFKEALEREEGLSNRIIAHKKSLHSSMGIEEHEDSDSSIIDAKRAKDLEIIRKAYIEGDDGSLALNIYDDSGKEDLEKKKIIREFINRNNLGSDILTPNKAHQLFGSFIMEYDPVFARLLYDNISEILQDSELMKQVGAIQRDFQRIKAGISGIGINLQNALNFVKENPYSNIDVGNEFLAARAKEAGYSQADFDEIQKIYNKCLEREASSIPRVKGNVQGVLGEYSYEMLRLDDSLALTIGTMTDCCQEIHGEGESAMLHSVLSKDGRVFVVRDKEGRVVAQSWVWRNGDTICFDNIEIPERILKLYGKDNDRGELPEDVLKVYEEASKQIMQVDKEEYESLTQEEIAQEESEEVVAGKITIGLGYNDINSAIQKHMRDRKDKNIRMPKPTVEMAYKDKSSDDEEDYSKLVDPYSDAEVQYVVTEREDRAPKKNFEARMLYEDDVNVYDGENFPEELAVSLLRMEEAMGREKLNESGLSFIDTRKSPSLIIEEVADIYELSSENTKVLATPRTAVIIDEEDNKILVGDILKVPLKEGLSAEQIEKGERIVARFLTKTIKQLKRTGKEIDLSRLDEEQQKLFQEIMNNIETER